MLRVNIDIHDRLINAKQEILVIQNLLYALFVKFLDKQAGVKAMRSSYLGRHNFRVSIEKCETEIPIKKDSASPSSKRTQFPLTLV